MIPSSVRIAEFAIVDRHPMDALDLVDAAIAELDDLDSSCNLTHAACCARTSLLEWRADTLDAHATLELV
jgi:hypothetical protein